MPRFGFFAVVHDIWQSSTLLTARLALLLLAWIPLWMSWSDMRDTRQLSVNTVRYVKRARKTPTSGSSVSLLTGGNAGQMFYVVLYTVLLVVLLVASARDRTPCTSSLYPRWLL